MKKLAIIVMAALVAVCLTACGSSSGSMSGEPAQPSSQQSGQDDGGWTDVDDSSQSKYYDVSIKGCETVDDGNAVLLTFGYANNTSTAVNFQQAIVTTVFQDGVQLGQSMDYVGPTGSDGVTPDYMLKVEPGSSATVHMAFALDSSGDVHVQCVPGFVDGEYPMDEGVIAEATFQV